MKKIIRFIILGLLALVVAIGAGYGIISKMQQQEVALSERAMLNLEALARGESPPGGCENPPGYQRGNKTVTTTVKETTANGWQWNIGGAISVGFWTFNSNWTGQRPPNYTRITTTVNLYCCQKGGSLETCSYIPCGV